MVWYGMLIDCIDGNMLHRMGARARINELQNGIDLNPDRSRAIGEIVALATQYSLMSSHTSLVAVADHVVATDRVSNGNASSKGEVLGLSIERQYVNRQPTSAILAPPTFKFSGMCFLSFCPDLSQLNIFPCLW
jgi:hypothetical protein